MNSQFKLMVLDFMVFIFTVNYIGCVSANYIFNIIII